MTAIAAPEVPVAIVAAVGRNMAIGRANRLPWSMPGDLAHFRACTLGKPMIMGRRTFESIGRVLPGRESIIVTRGRTDLPPGAWRAGSIEEALALAAARAQAMQAEEIVLAGGATLFERLIDRVARLRMTFVDLAPEADTFFPRIDETCWEEESRVVPRRHPGDEATCSFVDFVRKPGRR